MTMVNTRSQKRRGMPKRATRKNFKNRNAQTKKRGQQKGGEDSRSKSSDDDFSTNFNNLKKSCSLDALKFKASKANPDKNRYKDILSTDTTRVKLNDGGYINANYITLGGPEQKGGFSNPFTGKRKQEHQKPLTILVDENEHVVPLASDPIMIDSDENLILTVPGIGEFGNINLGNYEKFKEKIGNKTIDVNIDNTPKTIEFNRSPMELIGIITEKKELKELGSFAKLEKPQKLEKHSQEIPQFDYIAAQGPKPNTINDFWQMVVENDVNCIVMVTGLIEMGKPKCADYFNSTGDVNSVFTHNNIDFTLKNTQDNDVYEERTFTYLKDGETKTVTHLWFRKWPDHGVPDEGDFMELLERFNELKKASPGPFKPLVHCSAGVGRTGTFIVLDHILYDKQGNLRTDLDLSTDEKILNLMDDTICQLRQQRNIVMVQTKEQYEFIYKVINTQLSTRNRSNSGIGNSGNSSGEEEERLPPDPKETINSPVEITMKNKGGANRPDDLAKNILLLFKDEPTKRIKIVNDDEIKLGKLNDKKELVIRTLIEGNETKKLITYKELEDKLIEILNKSKKYTRGNTDVKLEINPGTLMVNFPENVDDVYSMSEPEVHLSIVVKGALKINNPPNAQTGGRKSKSKSKTRTQKRRSTNPENKRTRKSKK